MRSLVVVLLTALLLVCQSAAAPDEKEGEKNLLDVALSQADLRRTDLLVPADYVEIDPFRRAVVSRLLEHPLEMPGYARGLADALRKQVGPVGMFDLILAQERIQLGKPERTFSPDGKVMFPAKDLEFLIGLLVRAARKGQGDDLKVIAALRENDGGLVADARRAYVDDGKKGEHENPIWMTGARMFLERAAGFDRKALARYCEASLLSYELLAAAASYAPLDGEKTRALEIEGLRVVIGGPGNDVHTGKADIVLDVGGDDIYRDLDHDGPDSVVIDLSGNDTYVSGENGGPGAAELGFAIIVDLAGDDVYRGKNFSLASGLFGLGVIDDRSGNDVYECGEAGLGAGIFGWGLLLDRSGNDVYVGRGFCQGFAGVDGFGALVDLAGNDVYVAGGKTPDPREVGVTQSLSQGFAYGMRPFASGGIALLLDAGGNDAYEGDYFAQGSSYWFALGALVDLGGNDRYAARRYSGGAGIHLSLGVLVDEAGNDAYAMGLGVGLGCGHDYAHGILLDMAGDDTYQGAWLTLGAGNACGTGILCDVAGNDGYHMTRSSLGWGTYHKKRQAGSIGLLLDGGGTDAYPAPGVLGKGWSHGKYGGGIDGDGGDPFPVVHLVSWLNTLPERPEAKLPFFLRETGGETPPSADDGMLDVYFDVLARFEPGLEDEKKKAREGLTALVPGSARKIMRYLGSPNVMVLIEVDRVLGAAGDAAVPDLIETVRLCEAPPGRYPPRVVAGALRILGKIQGRRATLGLIDVVPHAIISPDADIRRTALSTVGRIGPGNAALDKAVIDLLGSKDLRERAAAARAVGELRLVAAVERLRELKDDAHFTVRFAAAAALEAIEGREKK
jgi:HEAT repeats